MCLHTHPPLKNVTGTEVKPVHLACLCKVQCVAGRFQPAPAKIPGTCLLRLHRSGPRAGRDLQEAVRVVASNGPL